MKKMKPNKPPSEEYRNFERGMRQILCVPRSELDWREAEYQKSRKAAKKKKAA